MWSKKWKLKAYTAFINYIVSQPKQNIKMKTGFILSLCNDSESAESVQWLVGTTATRRVVPNITGQKQGLGKEKSRIAFSPTFGPKSDGCEEIVSYNQTYLWKSIALSIWTKPYLLQPNGKCKKWVSEKAVSIVFYQVVFRKHFNQLQKIQYEYNEKNEIMTLQ